MASASKFLVSLGTWIADIIRGIYAYKQSIDFLGKHYYEIYPFIIAPGLLSILYFVSSSIGIYFAYPKLRDWVIEKLKVQKRPTFRFLVSSSVLSTLIVVALFGYKPTVMTLMHPVFSKLSAKVEHIQFGKQWKATPNLIPPGDDAPWYQVVVGSLRQYLTPVGFFLLTNLLLPGIGGPVSTIGLLLINSYYQGRSLAEPELRRRGMSRVERNALIEKRGGVYTGIGVGVNLLLLMVPVIGWVFGLPLGTIATTLETTKMLQKMEQQQVVAINP